MTPPNKKQAHWTNQCQEENEIEMVWLHSKTQPSFHYHPTRYQLKQVGRGKIGLTQNQPIFKNFHWGDSKILYRDIGIGSQLRHVEGVGQVLSITLQPHLFFKVMLMIQHFQQYLANFNFLLKVLQFVVDSHLLKYILRDRMYIYVRDI